MLSKISVGFSSNIAIVNQFLSLKALVVLDIGCGDMKFSRLLIEQGAQVVAIDPDPIQATINRESDPRPSLEYIECGAEEIPLGSNTVDGIFFSHSLHHIPMDSFKEVFNEVSRVLKPGGFLYVIEPVDCSMHQVYKLFHDEERQLEAAQAALTSLAVPAFESGLIITYYSYSQFQSWEHFVVQYGTRSFNTKYSDADIRRPEVEAAFYQWGGANHQFQLKKQVMLLKGHKKSGAHCETH